jgi:hypothetical protein
MEFEPLAIPDVVYSVLDTRLLRAAAGLQAQHSRAKLREVLREVKNA